MAAQSNQTAAWQALATHYQQIKDVHLRQLFADDPGRGERLTAEGAGLYLDYSKNRITDETVRLLLDSRQERGVAERRDAMFRGEKINVTEQRAVLHVALRAPKDARILVDGHDVVPDVHQVLDAMAEFAERIRSGAWLGHTGKRIRNVINIGIGGSYLGPEMAYLALRPFSERSMTFRFVSNVDGADFTEATRDLDRRRDAVRHRLEDVHHARDDDQRGNRAQMAGRCAWARKPLSPSTSLRYRPTPKRCASSASTPPTCSASGTGLAAATRWIRQSACRP